MTAGGFDYFFSQDGLFVIPIEHLSENGIDPAFEAELIRRGHFSEDSAGLFNEAFRTYRGRCAGLHQRAPRYWFPPRIQHACIVTRPDFVRPYFQPFHRNSWLLYAVDFDPPTATVEFAAYQFLHAERMGLLQQVVPALFANLSYFLTLNEEQAAAFGQGCRATTRPDAEGFRALADALPWIRQLFHDPLEKPKLALPDARHMRDSGLVVPGSLRRPLADLQQAWSDSAAGVFARHRAAHGRPSGSSGGSTCAWLVENRPILLVTGAQGEILWDPQAPGETAALRRALAGATADGEEGICGDLAVVDHHSRRFLRSLREPHALADPAPYLTEGGLGYIHRTRKLIAYDIGPGRNEGRVWQSTPPYERLMLAARTVHEWGHLAAESGWIVVPEERREERKSLESELAALFERIHDEAPGQVRARVSGEVARLRAKSGAIGKALLLAMLAREEDFMANRLSRRFLNADEMDTYIRNNVSCRLQDYRPGTVYMQLIRQAYEFQYLRLSSIEDPLDWFLKSTWFAEHFIRNRIISESQFERLIELVGGICDCYEVDESKFDFRKLMDEKTVTLIAAMARNRAIGLGGDMPWRLPGELQHFKRTTMGKPIVMGRKTWEAIGRPLPGRQNIVVTRNRALEAEGCDIADSLEGALRIADGDEVMIAGGGELYRQALPLASRMVITLVDCEPEADTWFPEWPGGEWREVSRTRHPADQKNEYAFEIVEMVRREA